MSCHDIITSFIRDFQAATMRQTISKKPMHSRHREVLGDFTADYRVLLLIAMALLVGSGGAAAAWGLIKLIALATNMVWAGRISTAAFSMADAHPGAWMVAAPALGGLI